LTSIGVHRLESTFVRTSLACIDPIQLDSVPFAFVCYYCFCFIASNCLCLHPTYFTSNIF
jgi:hypothetical protein